jgi:lipopolysaccharide export system ATP-binding protein
MSINIHTKGLVKTYGRRTVVNNASVEVKQGEIVGLLGPNGAGKTTTFYMVVGLIKPDEGEVYLNNQNITKLAMYKRAQMGIGYLPQEASVFRKLSVEDNIAAVLEMTKLSKQEQRAKLESLLNEFRLQHVRKSNGDVLSGGERRRTEIARALAVDPKFILLDEPFAGIDPIAVEDIQAIVAKLKHKNIGILITDHNVTETLSICDRAYLLIEGKIFQHGTAEELASNEQVRKLYLGRNFELKRKDYLHEEARGEGKISINAMITSVDNAINWIDQINEADKLWPKNILSGGIISDIDAPDPTDLLFTSKPDNSEAIGLIDFNKFLTELKASLSRFARESGDKEILQRIDNLNLDLNDLRDVDTRNTLKGDLSTIRLFLNAQAQ